MKRTIGVLLLVACVATIGFTQAKKNAGNSLIGAWKIVETTSPTGQKNSSPQPGLYIFTSKHYSAMAVSGTQPRPKYADQSKATDKDKAAVFDQFTANSGTYTVSGNTLKVRPIVAKNEFVMSGPEIESEIKLEGNNLTLTALNGGQKGSVTKLMRVE
jgi:hypothetical protein